MQSMTDGEKQKRMYNAAIDMYVYFGLFFAYFNLKTYKEIHFFNLSISN